MDDWRVIDSVAEYETGWYTGGYDLVEQPDGSEKRYYWAELPPAAIVVALVDEDVVFVRQYRPAVRRRCLELPAGIVEGEESFEAAAARELAEETGFRAAETEELAAFWVATGVLRHRRGIVAATGLEPGDPDTDQNEFLDVERVPAAEAVETALAAPANDATLEGLLLAERAGLL